MIDLPILALIQSSLDVSSVTGWWEVAKGTMVALATMGVAYLIRSDRHREILLLRLVREVFDEGGTNGLKWRQDATERRLAELELWKIDQPRIRSLEEWRIEQETVEAVEQERMKHVGRSPERFRDKMPKPEGD